MSLWTDRTWKRPYIELIPIIWNIIVNAARTRRNWYLREESDVTEDPDVPDSCVLLWELPRRSLEGFPCSTLSVNERSASTSLETMLRIAVCRQGRRHRGQTKHNIIMRDRQGHPNSLQ